MYFDTQYLGPNSQTILKRHFQTYDNLISTGGFTEHLRQF